MDSMNLDPENFFFKVPLYEEIEITPENWRKFTYLIQFSDRVEGYNPVRQTNSTFSGYKYVSGKIENGNLDWLFHNGGIFELSIRCLRYEDVLTNFVKFTPKLGEDEDGDIIKLEEYGTLTKIGQSPPMIDFHLSQIKRYKKLLSNEMQKEFVRAIGLVSHGVGIGSFVYLRRIFENLIQQAHQIASENVNWDETQYNESRLSDKIELLKNYLPEFLVENKVLYGIMSKGIHELSEKECLDYFDTIRLGIESILDEKLEQEEKNKRKIEAIRKIEELKKKLK